MTVTIKRIGGSLAVLIPRAIALESGLAEGASLDVKRTAEGILFRPAERRPRRPIDRIVKQINRRSYVRRNAELNEKAVGREIG